MNVRRRFRSPLRKTELSGKYVVMCIYLVGSGHISPTHRQTFQPISPTAFSTSSLRAQNR